MVSANGDKTILHCDLNGFYASVEALSHPEIGDKPMAVTGNPRLRHGIILAKNESAKKFGVSTGEAIWQAKRKCPDLILLPTNHDEYEKYSKLVNEIYYRFTNKVEPFGIDESWLDVTASMSLFGSGVEIADKIRQTVKAELGLTISVGVSFNKIFSKLGSDFKKPDATTVFGREQMQSIIYNLPVRDMLYVGRSTGDTLRRMGIRTIGELAKADVKFLIRRFGKMGEVLSASARGEGFDDVAFFGESDDVKSIGNSITFKRDLLGIVDIKHGLEQLAEKVARRLVEANVKAKVVQIVIKGADFASFTRQKNISIPTNSRKDLFETALLLVKSNWDTDIPIRMLGITGCNLVDASVPIQADLFDTPSTDKKQVEKFEKAFFDIKDKFGDDSISFASTLDSDLGPF